MVDWVSVHSAIERFCRSTVQRGVSCIWDREAQVATGPVYVVMDCGPASPRGVDDVELVDLGGGEQSIAVRGLREFTLSLTAHSMDQAPAKAAKVHIERLRSALMHPQLNRHLHDAGIGIIESMPARDIDIMNDGRLESRSILEVRLSVGSELSDVNLTGDAILTAVVSGDHSDSSDEVVATMPSTEIPES